MSQLLKQAEIVEDLTLELLRDAVLAMEPSEDVDVLAHNIGFTFIHMMHVSMAVYAVISGNATAKQMLQPIRDAIADSANFLHDLNWSQESDKLVSMVGKYKPSVVDVLRRKK